jgi:hypothetical protein
MMAAIQEMKKWKPGEIENSMQYEPNKFKWTSLIVPLLK